MTTPFKIAVGGILKTKGLAAVRVMGIPDRPGVAFRVFMAISGAGINVEFIAHTVDERCYSHITFCVGRGRAEEAMSVLELHRKALGCPKLSTLKEVALVSVFGPHFREKHGIAGTFFCALAEAGINILAISTSVSTCTCLITEAQLEPAIWALHKFFQVPG